jgi:hypothetical protein
MEVTFKEPSAAGWRGRGHPRREVPTEVREMADRTYSTGKVASVSYTSDEQSDVGELRRILNSYARSRGLRVRTQDNVNDDGSGVFHFRMVGTAKP